MPQTINAAETAFSAVQSIRATKPCTITLADAYRAIVGPAHAATVARIREHIVGGRKADADKLKKTLPGFLFAGVFTRRKADALARHSGLLVLDFDDCGTSRKAELASDPHAVLCFTSPSGNGLKLVIRIEPDGATHGASFDAARVYFMERYGVEADPSGRDVCRLCFVSHDPEALLSGTAEVLQRVQSVQRSTECTEKGIGDMGAPLPTPPKAVQADLASPLVEDVVNRTQPTRQGQRHRKVFELARGLRFDCGLLEESMQTLKPIVRRWHAKALPKIGTESFDETWSDFVSAFPRATKALADGSLPAAWKAVHAGDIPPCAAEYDSLPVRKLVALCWHLSRPVGTFYLSTHASAALLGYDAMQVHRWLRMLVADGLLVVVKPGTCSKATTYQWMGNP